MGIGLAATAALLALFRAGASAWGQSRLRDYRDATRAEWDAERARIRERSRPAGEGAAQEDCGASYARTASIQLDVHPEWIKRALEAGPGAPLSPELAAEIERRRPEIDAFRQTARCSRYELPDDSAWIDYGPIHPVWHANRAVLVQGRWLEAKGDTRGALDRYLTVAKVGADLSAGSAIAGLIGIHDAERAYRRAAALVAGAPRLPAAELAELDRALEERGRHLPRLADVLRRERLHLRQMAMRLSDGGPLPEEELRPLAPSTGARALTAVLPMAAVFGHALPPLDAQLRAAEQMALDAQRDSSQVTRFQEVAADSLAADVTGLGAMLDAEHLQRTARRDCALRASYLLARAAVQAERAYADGGYPEALRTLPQDPCGTGPLVYERSPGGDGYTLSSVGENGTVDGPRAAGGAAGDSDDIVVTRRGSDVL
ncbi:hypothetical protein WMF26_11100 [Sorangium sp. So ce185]|uniref:hypothetical protein n=1 Tax=Sorangium sp. So ce185 TaxID=3133287 RepID=UPI003F605793